MMNESEYPHETLWRKIKEKKQIVVIWSIATVTVLTLGYITFLIAANVPATDAWTANTLQQPSAFSYTPTVLIVFCAVLSIVVYSYSLEKWKRVDDART